LHTKNLIQGKSSETTINGSGAFPFYKLNHNL
jgi:hypothetical protein